MMRVKFYDFGDICDDKLKYAVIMAEYEGKWIFCRHRSRRTWEIPGGRRELQEDIDKTAQRELYEETGAMEFSIKRVCVYSVLKKEEDGCETESMGALYYADIQELGEMPGFEISEIHTFDSLPEDLTYPQIQPFLFQKVTDFKSMNDAR